MSASNNGVIKKVPPGEAYKKKGMEWEDPEFLNNYPSVYAYLTQTEYNDGTARVTATITLYVDSRCLTLILNDRENNRSVFINGSSLYGAFTALDEALTSGSADWRSKKSSPPGTGYTPF
jgi:hypothetical protein